MRPKKAGTCGSAARARSRSARAAPRRSEAQASTPASVIADAAARISVRQSAARSRWARSAARTGSSVGTVSGVAEGRDTVGGRYARGARTSTDFPDRSTWPLRVPGKVAGLDEVDVDGAELVGGREQDRLRGLADLDR